MVSIRRALLLAGTVAAACAVAADTAAPAPAVVPLWPALQGKSEGILKPAAGDNVQRFTNVENPTLTVFPAPKRPGGKPAPAMLVCPGGGYGILAFNLEGTEIAAWLNAAGVTVFVLKYRVPDNREAAFQDARRAMGLIRHNAKEWNVDPARVGAIGFSAGAHLTARLSANFDRRGYEPIDEADKAECRPDFSVLVYPAYLAGKTGELAPELPVSPKTPPAFLVQTQDDPCRVACSLAYYGALVKAKVPAELHLFPTGGHGYGLRPSRHAVSGWPALCQAWLHSLGAADAPAAAPKKQVEAAS